MSRASSSNESSTAYAGDVCAEETWGLMSKDPNALLVDVRTKAEWNFVGLPDLSSLARPLILVEWQSYPPGPVPNLNFARELAGELERAGYEAGSPIFFLCRSGSRSRAAAIAATAAGYGPCFNVRDGFEGALDQERRRGRAEGWKAAGLPWVQS